MKTVILIDGENFKRKIFSILTSNGVAFSSWELFDFQKLLKSVLGETIPDKTIFYGAKLKQYRESLEKSQQLIQEQRHLKTHLTEQGITVSLSGNVRRQESNSTGQKIFTFKEKGVDVKIAIDIICFACDKTFEHVILASSDSDLQPAITEAKKRGLSITYLGFEKTPNKGLIYTTDRTLLIRDSEVVEAYKSEIVTVDTPEITTE